METFWHLYFFQPTLNLLIWIYNGWAGNNMGWAVVYLTLIIRTALLPFTILEERDTYANEALYREIETIQKGYTKDPITMKEEVRKALKRRKVHPWVKAITLGVQFLTLVLLYQVFVHGATGERLVRDLYPWIKIPGSINNNFYGFDIIARHDFVWPGFVAVWLALDIYRALSKKKTPTSQGDVFYFVFFPLFVFFALWVLPMAKALFILTSMIFSAILHPFFGLFFREKKAKAAGGHH